MVVKCLLLVSLVILFIFLTIVDEYAHMLIAYFYFVARVVARCLGQFVSSICDHECWGLVLKCYELRTRQHKMLNVNTVRPSKHYLPLDIMSFGRRLWRTYLHHFNKQGCKQRHMKHIKSMNNHLESLDYSYHHCIIINKHQWYQITFNLWLDRR